MLIQKQYSKSVLLIIQIEIETRQCFSLQKKRKKPFCIFRKELLKYCECCPTTQLPRVPRFCFLLIQYQCNMTQTNTLNIKLSHSQLDKLKSEIKNNTEVTSKVLLNAVGDSYDENNFPYKLLLTNAQVPGFVKLLQMVHQLI